MKHLEMNSILKEKNRELIKEIEHKNAPLVKKINKLTKDLEMSKSDYEDIKIRSRGK